MSMESAQFFGNDLDPMMSRSEKSRLDHIDHQTIALSGRMDGFESRLINVEHTGAETNEIAHKLLARQGGYEATRGMIPSATIWQGLAFFLALTGFCAKLLWDQEAKIDAKLNNVVNGEDARHSLVLAKIDHLRDDADEFEFLQKRILEKIEILALVQTRHDEKILKTWDEIVDHENYMDHPARQTYTIEGIEKRLDAIELRQTESP